VTAGKSEVRNQKCEVREKREVRAHGRLRAGLSALVMGFLLTTPMAQESRPAFDVASVKRNVLGAPGPGGGPTALGQFRPDGLSYTNETLTMLIRAAYQIRDEWIIGGPEWARTHRFDVIARASRKVSSGELRLMMRGLLEERFGLVVVSEKRERPAYALRLNRADSRLGPDLRRASEDCEARRKATDPVAWIKQLPLPSSGAGPSTMDACVTIEVVAAAFERTLNATIVDETGLIGRWDFVISHAGLSSGMMRGRNVELEERPSIFDAAREQLGLRLDRRKEPGFHEVLVIRSAETPTDN
jgi:uncharacterized protein (TIGR03435 family)